MTFDSCIEITKALSDVTRLRIVALLEGCELSVNEITSVIGTGQSGISRNLKILTDSGILACRKDGLWSFYKTVKDGNVRTLIDPIIREILSGDDAKADRKKGTELLETRSRKMVGYFNAVAREWDSRRSDLLGSFDIAGELLRRVRGNTIADIGCGNGSMAETLAAEGFSVIGVDSSPKMIDAARRRLGVNGNAEFRIGECEHLPMRDSEIDCAIAVLVLHHLSNPEKAVAEFSRVLSPGGRIIIADFDAHDQEILRDQHHDLRLGITQDEMYSWLSSAGLSADETVKFKLASGLTLVFTVAMK
jgi:ArsR family transcriptional regulator